MPQPVARRDSAATMSPLTSVPVGALAYERFEEVLEPEQWARFREVARLGRELLAGRVVWNVNSTARGGGVAEMLVSLLAYARGAGVDARWEVISGDPAFFALTKRIHNNLHGAAGDGGALGDGRAPDLRGGARARRRRRWRGRCRATTS